MHCWPRYLLWTLVALLGLGGILGACGQKGDLYLPQEQDEQKQEQTRQ